MLPTVTENTRGIVLDTETTGLDVSRGHRIIEIGCVELINRRRTGNDFHTYLCPERTVDPGALAVHGIDNEFLSDKPTFAETADRFMSYVSGAQLIIHNAPFDVGFLDHELAGLGAGFGPISRLCEVIDTLDLARHVHPGQRNTLDALCKRYGVESSHRKLHGARLDAELLAEVYLAMTGGQVTLMLGDEDVRREPAACGDKPGPSNFGAMSVIRATEEERAAHMRFIAELDRMSGGNCRWNDWDSPQ